MPKIIICDSDEVEHEFVFPKERFVIIITDNKIHHMDCTDENMWKAQPDLRNLGMGHRKVITGEPRP